jgi:hypothetical protein
VEPRESPLRMRLFRCPNQHAEEYNSIRGASYAVLKGLRGEC